MQSIQSFLKNTLLPMPSSLATTVFALFCASSTLMAQSPGGVSTTTNTYHCNPVVNGDFPTNIAGWTSTGGWGVVSAFVGNSADNVTNQTLKQTISNFGTTDSPGIVKLSFDIKAWYGGLTSASTTEIWFGGTKYGTISVTALGVGTGAGNNGATFSVTNYPNNIVVSNVILSIPWTSPPASADLEFRFTAGASASDIYFDNISVNTACNGAIKLWLKADAGTTMAGTKVSSWASQGNAVVSVAQATDAKRPILKENGMNFNPALDYNGGQVLTNATNAGLVFPVTNSPTTMYAVTTNRDDAIGWHEIINFDGEDNFPSPALGWYGQQADAYIYGMTTPDSKHTTVIPLNTPTIMFARSSNAVRATAGSVRVGYNGLVTQQSFTNTDNTYSAAANEFAIGAETDLLREPTNGLLPELIVYNAELTDAEVKRVNTYFGIKYGIHLSDDYLSATNAVIWDKTANTTYHNNVFGIGKETAQGLDQKQSKSENTGFQPILSTTGFNTTNATNTTSLANASFELSGSDAGAASLSTPFVFGGMNNRITRLWKIKETGTVGNVQVLIAKSEMLGTNVNLLRSSTTTFAGGTTMIPMTTITVNTIEYYTATIDFTDGDYYTFGAFVTAPGCLPTALWLKADAKTYTDNGTTLATNGQAIQQWNDNANGFNVSQITAGSKPLFNTATGINFNPSLTFDGSNDVLRYAYPITNKQIINRTDGAMYVVSRSTTVTNANLIGFNVNANHPSMATYGTTGKAFVYVNDLSFTHDAAEVVAPNIPYIVGASWKNNASASGTALKASIFKNGTPNYYTNLTNIDATAIANHDLSIGGDTDWGTINGDIAEVIVLEDTLTIPQRMRVESYLAIKYGITLPNNYVDGSGSTIYTLGAYNNNVFGIGREVCQGLDQKQSKSVNAGFQPIFSTTGFNATNATNTTSLTDATFEMAGSDNGAASFATAFVFGNANNRMTRIWKVQETGTVGTVRVLVPQSDMPGINPSLLRSASTTFNASSMIAMSPITIGGVAYYYADVNFDNGDFFSFSTFMTAPGGVTANLQLWFDPAKGVATSGSALSTWANQGGLGATANLLNGTASRPTLSPAIAAQNYNPFVTVGANQRMWTNPVMPASIAQTSFLTATLASTNVTAASMIYRNDVTTAFTHEHGLGNAGALNSVMLHYWTGGGTSNRLNTGGGVTGTKPFLYGGRVRAGGAAGAKSVSINGSNTDYADDVTNTLAAFDYFLFGDDTYGNTGNVNEIITYDRDLTDTERNKVNTYLGIKYGLTLSNNYISAGGTTLWDRAAGSFNNRITGIGREGVQGLHQKQSKSVDADAIITMGIDNTIAATNATNAGAFDTDASFLIWGDNNGTGTVAVTPGTACTPASVDKATNRAFKVVETGTVESVKVSADLSSFGFSANYPVFMQVASDAAFATMLANVPMTLNGSNYETNYNFDGTNYIRFTGNTTPPANLCTGADRVINWNGFNMSTPAPTYWNWGQRAKTYTVGTQEFQVSVTDADNVMYAKQWYPVTLANYLYMPRYDGKPNSKITTKIKMVSTGDHTTPMPAQAVDFQIRDVDGWVWGKDVATVYGKLAGTTVTAKISKPTTSPITLGPITSGQNKATGAIWPWDWSYWGYVYVTFDSPVDEVYIEYTKQNQYNPVFNDLAIGHINVQCAVPTPVLPNPDNVYIHKQAMANSVDTGEDFTYKFTVQNNNCAAKTINFSDILPAASLSWRDSSLTTSMTFASASAYGNSQNLNITGLNVPVGISYLYINAKGTAAGTFQNQANFTVTGGTGVAHLSDNPGQTGAADPTPITIVSKPNANMTITKAVDKTKVLQNGVVKYTYTLTNNESSSINTFFTDNLDKSARFVASTLTTIAGSPQINPYADSAAIVIRDVILPANGSLSFSIDVNVKTTAIGDTIYNRASITPDPSVTTFRQVTKTSNTVITVIAAPLTVTAPASANVATNAAIAGNAATELAPVGGVGAYTYTDVTTTCTPPSGSTGQITLTSLNASTGAYNYTAPATAGTYYYCIKVCDASLPTASCVTSTYTVNVTSGTPLTASNPPAQTPTAGSGTQNGNAVTELAPVGGTPAYTYTNDTGNPSCNAPSGATAITGVTVDLNTGAYSYPTPATPGAYYFCIKICDNGAPQQCVTKTYTVNVQPTMLAVPLPAPLTPIAGSGPQNGTPSTPTGGTAPYHYSNGSNLGTCIAPSGATLITLISVDPNTGAFQYTTPSTAGSYYFCIQTCDSSSPTAQCVNTTYPVNVLPAACAAAAQTLSK
jgi:large repetitive protein